MESIYSFLSSCIWSAHSLSLCHSFCPSFCSALPSFQYQLSLTLAHPTRHCGSCSSLHPFTQFPVFFFVWSDVSLLFSFAMEEWNRVRVRQYSSLLLHKLRLFLSFSLPAKSTFLILWLSRSLECIHFTYTFLCSSIIRLVNWEHLSILSCFFAVLDEPWHNAEFSLPEIFFSSFYALSFRFTHHYSEWFTMREGIREGETEREITLRSFSNRITHIHTNTENDGK